MTVPTPSLAVYDAQCTDEALAALAQVRRIARSLRPTLEERLSYGVPTFFDEGRRVVHAAGWDKHLALYPVPASPAGDPGLIDDLAEHRKGKGTLHFPYAAGIPWPLVTRVIAAHLARIGVVPEAP